MSTCPEENMHNVFTAYGAGIDFKRHNLTSVEDYISAIKS